MSAVALKLAPAQPETEAAPRWRIRLVGLYSDADERAERDVLGWLLCGGEWPSTWMPLDGRLVALRGEHFASLSNRLVFSACSAARARDGSVHPVRVMECLRHYGHRDASVAAELTELMRESLEFTEPPSFRSFLERSERRLRVLKLEREADELRRGPR